MIWASIDDILMKVLVHFITTYSPMSFLFIFKKDIEIYMEKYTQKIEQIEKSYLRGYLNIFTASHHLSGFQKIDITAVNFTKKKFKVIWKQFCSPRGQWKRKIVSMKASRDGLGSKPGWTGPRAQIFWRSHKLEAFSEGLSKSGPGLVLPF